jgi:hypothetical protein
MSNSALFSYITGIPELKTKSGKLCVSGVNMFSRYVLFELVFLLRYEF